ncbi:MAG: phage holin family protein [Deltaproteobacteria bacterium]|nr:phage holin family protein [Deltaproteobacteria bacterium]
MAQLVASTLGFALGFLLVPMLVPGMRVKGMGAALKVGLACGVLSVLLGKLLMVVLSIIFLLPIALLGPLAVVVIQALVNATLLAIATRITSGVEFDRTRSLLWAAFALTVMQWVARALL